MLSHAGCFLDANVEPYYGRVVAPSAQEFNWSDGGLPQTFDPAFAAAPPDTDLVRAIFEGLTDYDPQTLAPIPAVATRWEPSNGDIGHSSTGCCALVNGETVMPRLVRSGAVS